MPYRWTETAPDKAQMILWPHRSLPRAWFAIVIFAAFIGLSIPLGSVLGTWALWGLMPFLGLTLAGLWWALESTYKSGRVYETLSVSEDEVHLLHQAPKSRPKEWQCHRYWAQVDLHSQDGPIPNYVTLRGNGREVEIGAFLSEEERQELYHELCRTIRPNAE